MATGTAPLGASERAYRARRIGLTFGRVYLGIKANQFIARRLRPADMAERWSDFNRQSAREIYRTAIELRGLILKGCQFIGARADVLPPEYVKTLSRLQDRVPPSPFERVRERVEEDLGAPLEKAFREFSERPVASASLAQVHDATLHDGRRVAVKVQYPDIAAQVRGDLRNLRTLFRAVGLLEKDFDLLPIMDELASQMPRELDFLAEGRSSEAIAEMLAHRKDVVIPKIEWELSSQRVLVMEFMEGIKISDVEGLAAAGIDPEAVTRTLVEAFAEQILVHGVFHADPHPGNLFVRPGPDGPVLVMLDFGLTKELPPHFREGVLGFAGALLQGNAEAMAKALVDLGFEVRDGSPEALGEIAELILHAAQTLRDADGRDPELLRELREDIPEHIRANPIVRIPHHLVLMARVFGLLSGVARSLDVKLDLYQTLLPYAFAKPPERT